MRIRRACTVVLSLAALCGTPRLAGAQPSKGVGDTAARRAPADPVAGEEKVPEGEARVIEELNKFLLQGMILGAPDGKPTARGQHPKHHGFVVAKFRVSQGLPEELRVGLFREPKTYTAVIRFSNGSSMVDSVPDVHGMAIKVLGVSGEKLLENERDAKTQDFVLMDHPVFFSKDVSNLFAFGKTRAALAMDKNLQARLKDLPPEQRAKEMDMLLAKERPNEAKILGQTKLKPLPPSPLALEYFSTTPYKFGRTAVKYRARPDSSYAAGKTKTEGGDYLREAMVEHLTTRKQPVSFGFYVQRQGDPRTMPIEDPTVEWTSGWQKVATIEIGDQVFDFPARVEWGNALSYTPWHALKEHRPLGGINRARKPIYAASSELRHQNLGVTPKEPTEADIPMKK